MVRATSSAPKRTGKGKKRAIEEYARDRIDGWHLKEDWREVGWAEA